jgi:hypothetical protein
MALDESFTAARYEALLRADLASFAHRAFCELNPRGGFATNWHVEAITARLAQLCAGRIRRLIISMPPRHLKSHLASVAFPAWCLGHDPSTQSSASATRDQSSRDPDPWQARRAPSGSRAMTVR